MRVLALDTTTREGSVAIVDDGRVIFERRGDPSRSHAERLPSDLVTALDGARCSWHDIDLYAVAAGPGSFTGLRIGIATIQGLAFVFKKRVVPVSALTALAADASRALAPGAHVGAWIDAHRGEVFSALYRVQDAAVFGLNRLIEIDLPSVRTAAATLSHWQDLHATPVAIAGDGAVLYRDVIVDLLVPIEPPALAGIIGQLAIARAGAGHAVDPAGVQPLYVRRPDAEVAREFREAR